jgi:hypothetical protein
VGVTALLLGWSYAARNEAVTNRKEKPVSNLVPVWPTSARQSGSTGRALSRLDERTQFGLAEIEAQAELQAARTAAVGYVAKRAMQEVAMLSQMELQLATLVPLATGRLQAIGDMAALEAAEIVGDTVRRVSR